MKTLFKYFKIWLKLTAVATQVAFTSRFGAVIFIIAKILRFTLFILFIFIITSKTKSIAGFTLWEVILFLATFNLIDALPQFFLREVYRFRYYVVSGFFDFILIKPFSPLFRALFGGSDMFDLSILIISVLFIFVSFKELGLISLGGILIYFTFIINAFLIALSLHILVLAIGILTTEVDNTIMLYRDFTQMGRFPVDIYREPISFIITFVIPVGIMMTFPVKAMMGLLSKEFIFMAFLIGIFLFAFSIKFWRFSLKHYSSASS